MKYPLLFLHFLFTETLYAQSQVWISDHFTKSGTFVPGHYQTTKNKVNHGTRDRVPSEREQANQWQRSTNEWLAKQGVDTTMKPVDQQAFQQAMNREIALQAQYTTQSVYPVVIVQPAPSPTYSPVLVLPPPPKPLYIGPRGGVYHISPSGYRVYYWFATR